MLAAEFRDPSSNKKIAAETERRLAVCAREDSNAAAEKEVSSVHHDCQESEWELL